MPNKAAVSLAVLVLIKVSRCGRARDSLNHAIVFRGLGCWVWSPENQPQQARGARLPLSLFLAPWARNLLSRSRISLQVHTTLEITQGQIASQSPTDATRFWLQLYGS